MADAATAAVLPHAAATAHDPTNSAAGATTTVAARRTTTGVAQTAARQRHHFQQGLTSTFYLKCNYEPLLKRRTLWIEVFGKMNNLYRRAVAD